MSLLRRSRIDRALGAAVLLCLLAGVLAGAASPVPTLPVDQVRPGMTGVGRTVFQGHVPEEFQVEILGVLKNAIGPQQDMILSRLHGKNVERTGVIAGMSGSPVMVDGKLVGAISYRLGSFEKEAIAGITPIADMLKAADFPPAPPAPRAAALLAEWLGREGKENPLPPSVPLPGGQGTLTLIGTPLVFSGFPEEVVRQAASFFRSRGLEPIQGGGGTGSVGPDYPIEPGVAVAGSLVRGDLSLSGTGTLTHVDGNRIWAFGHPFLGLGAIRMPMTRAEILVTYPSSLGSFKIANSTSLIGTLVQDRLTSIQGELGAAPETIPVSVELASPGGHRRLSYEVFENETITPLLIALTTQASLQRVLEYSGEVTYRTDLTIEVEGHEPVRYASVESTLGSLQQPAASAVAGEVAAVFNVVYGNRFEASKVKAVRLRVDSIPEARIARIGDVSIGPSSVRPGEEITVRTAIEPYRGEAFIREFRVRIPPDTPRGTINVTISNAANLNAMAAALLQRRFVGASKLDQVIEFLNGLKRDDCLYLQLSRRTQGAVVQGEVLPALPLSVLLTLGSSRFAGEEYPMADLPVLETFQKTDYVLTGGRRIGLQIR